MVCLLQNSVKVLIWANITCSIGVLMSVVLEVISLITLKNYGIFYVQVAFYGKKITDLKLYSFLNTAFLFVKLLCDAPLNKKTLKTYKMFILVGVQHNISI